jgi:hypothetical protein
LASPAGLIARLLREDDEDLVDTGSELHELWCAILGLNPSESSRRVRLPFDRGLRRVRVSPDDWVVPAAAEDAD